MGFLKTKGKTEVDLTEGNVFKKIIAFALPLVVSNLLQCLYNAADIIVVGRFAGELPLAAVGATSSIINLVTNLFIALSVGTSVTVATAIGARDKERTDRLVHTSIALSLVSGVIVTLVGVLGARTFLTMMNTPGNIMNMSVAYMRIFFAGSIFSLVYNFGAAILRAAGDSRRPLLYLAVAGVINVVLNLFFVIVLKMTADGVALATIISQAVSAFLVVRALLTHQGDCRLCLPKIRFHGAETRAVLFTGLPAGLQNAVFSLSNTMIQTQINFLDGSMATAGLVAEGMVVAGNTAALNIEGFIYTAMYAMHVTAVTAAGQNIGAKKYNRLNAVLRNCIIIVTVMGAVLGSLAYLCGRPLLSIYLKSGSPAIEYGLTRLSIIGFSYALCGIMDTVVGFTRGMGNTLLPMIVSVVGVCGIRIVWIYTVFAANKTLETLFYSYPATWIVTGAIQLVLCFIVKARLAHRSKIKEV